MGVRTCPSRVPPFLVDLSSHQIHGFLGLCKSTFPMDLSYFGHFCSAYIFYNQQSDRLRYSVCINRQHVSIILQYHKRRFVVSQSVVCKQTLSVRKFSTIWKIGHFHSHVMIPSPITIRSLRSTPGPVGFRREFHFVGSLVPMHTGWPQTWKTWNTQLFLWTWKTQVILREFCATSGKNYNKQSSFSLSFRYLCKTAVDCIKRIFAGVDVEWPWMKVIITLIVCCDNLWKSLKNSGNFFLLLCGHPGTPLLRLSVNLCLTDLT